MITVSLLLITKRLSDSIVTSLFITQKFDPTGVSVDISFISIILEIGSFVLELELDLLGFIGLVRITLGLSFYLVRMGLSFRDIFCLIYIYYIYILYILKIYNLYK